MKINLSEWKYFHEKLLGPFECVLIFKGDLGEHKSLNTRTHRNTDSRQEF